MDITTSTDSLRELDHRLNDGIEVRLLWNPVTNGVGIHVVDSRTGETFAFPVAAADALRAFRHPYVYAAPTGGDPSGHRAISSLHRHRG
jgi:hypothetical protein